MALWLVIAPVESTFVKNDLNIISSAHKIKSLIVHSHNPLSTLYNQIRIFWFLMENIWRAKGVYVWFSDYHSLLPSLVARLLGKQSIIIVGGYDAGAIPEINYGVFYSKFRGLFANLSYKLVNYILPVDASLIESTNKYINGKPIKIGFKHYVKNLNTKIITIPTGYESQRWYYKPEISREKLVLSIAIVRDWRNFKRKGFDLLLNIACKMPDVHFIIIGLGGDLYVRTKEMVTENVELIPFIPNEQLIEYYSRAKVYCQFSLFEGLPNTLCEAMLCECIPIGSDVCGIPNGIGNSGYILEKRDVQQAIALITRALQQEDNLGKQARERIATKFSYINREKKILSLLV